MEIELGHHVTSFQSLCANAERSSTKDKVADHFAAIRVLQINAQLMYEYLPSTSVRWMSQQPRTRVEFLPTTTLEKMASSLTRQPFSNRPWKVERRRTREANSQTVGVFRPDHSTLPHSFWSLHLSKRTSTSYVEHTGEPLTTSLPERSLKNMKSEALQPHDNYIQSTQEISSQRRVLDLCIAPLLLVSHRYFETPPVVHDIIASKPACTQMRILLGKQIKPSIF